MHARWRLRGALILMSFTLVITGCASAQRPAVASSLSPASTPTPTAGSPIPPTTGPITTSGASASAGAGLPACAPTDYTPPATANWGTPAPGGQSPFVPLRPSGAVICRYAGTTESRPAGTLAGSAGADATKAAALVAALNASVSVDTSASPPSCPTNSGALYTETFSYSDHVAVVATSSLDGCAMTMTSTRTVWTSLAALQVLATIVGGPQPSGLILGPQPSRGTGA
jgi:hypothetical protein